MVLMFGRNKRNYSRLLDIVEVMEKSFSLFHKMPVDDFNELNRLYYRMIEETSLLGKKEYLDYLDACFNIETFGTFSDHSPLPVTDVVESPVQPRQPPVRRSSKHGMSEEKLLRLSQFSSKNRGHRGHLMIELFIALQNEKIWVENLINQFVALELFLSILAVSLVVMELFTNRD